MDEEALTRAARTVERLATIEQPYTDVGARIFNSANIATVTATQTLLTYDSELYDTDGMHSTSVNTSRLTCTVAGRYTIGAAVRWASNATGYRQVFFRLNGGTVIGSIIQPAVSGATTDQVINVPYMLAVGDYVECYVVQASGGNLDVAAAARLSPDFWMTLQV